MLFPFTLVGATALQPFCFHTSTYLGPLLLGPQIYYRNGFIQLQTRLHPMHGPKGQILSTGVSLIIQVPLQLNRSSLPVYS